MLLGGRARHRQDPVAEELAAHAAASGRDRRVEPLLRRSRRTGVLAVDEVLHALLDRCDPTSFRAALGPDAPSSPRSLPEIKELFDDVEPPVPLDPTRPGSASTRP